MELQVELLELDKKLQVELLELDKKLKSLKSLIESKSKLLNSGLFEEFKEKVRKNNENDDENYEYIELDEFVTEYYNKTALIGDWEAFVNISFSHSEFDNYSEPAELQYINMFIENGFPYSAKKIFYKLRFNEMGLQWNNYTNDFSYTQ